MHKAVRVRRGFPIHGFVGVNGGGKTLAAVRTLRPSLDAGRPVYSTMRLLQSEEGWDDPSDAPDHPWYRRLGRLSTFLEAEKCDFLLDEVATSASSRQSSKMPHEIETFLQQLRKRDVRVFWTAPDWLRADKVLREVSLAVTYCKGFAPVQARDGDREWTERRLFLWTTYSAASFDEFQRPTTDRRRKTLQRVAREWYWRPAHDDQRTYDTLDQVDLILDDISDPSTCADCLGSIPKRRCDCSGDRAPVGRRTAAARAQAALAASTGAPDAGVR